MVTVLVNGLPGAGKTTLARALADALTLPPAVRAGLRRAGVTAVTEVWCDVPLEVARARFAARAAGRHLVHRDSSGTHDGDWDGWAVGAEPLGLGTVLRVDTTRPVDVPALAALLGSTP